MHDIRRQAYLPIDRRHALAAGHELPAHTEGAALFADIAGFTRLSRELTEAYGKGRGVDVLSEVLEAVYAVVVAHIHEHGGSVIGFSGDAVTCWFDDDPRGVESAEGDDGPLPGAVRALGCGLSLTRSLELLPPVALPATSDLADDEPGVKMGVKVAVASGPVSRSLAGDPAYQVVEVIGGETVARLADLEHEAALGEVVVDRATLRVVHDVLGPVDEADRRTTPSGVAVVVAHAPRVPITPWSALADGTPDDDTVRPWVGWQVRERADTALTELRPTVALFVRFAPFDLDGDPAAATDLDRFVRWVQHVIAPGDGNLIQVTVGDKSSYLYISFGAPRSHEDLAARAATAALALASPPDDLRMVEPLQIGSAHGMSRVGAYGSRESMTYGALGDGTNLAARLMGKADPGAILLTRRVADACGPSFRFEAHEPVDAKGFDEPVPVVVLVGRPAWLAPDAAHRRTLVGRDGELDTLVDRLAAAAVGPGGTTTVRGEAGVGKSHLIAEAKRRVLAEHDITWLAGQSDQLARTALFPFLAILRDLTFQELADGVEDRRALFDATIDALVDDLAGHDDPTVRELGRDLDEERSFLAALIDLAPTDSPYARHDPRGRFERCLRSYDLLVRAEAARRAVVIHLSDAHWMDDQSRQLLAILQETAAEHRLGLLLDERRDDHRSADASTTPSADVLDLRALDLAGVRSLVATLLGGTPSEELVRSLFDRSQGGPLFVEQLVVDLVERGRLDLDDAGRWALTDDRVDELPVDLSTLLVSRLDRLPVDVVDVAQRASVLGNELSCVTLTHLVDEPTAVDRAVPIGSAAGIWEVDADHPDRLVFRHALVRDAAYAMQPAARLRETHARAAVALRTVHGDDETLAAAMALHYERADDHAAAVRHLRRAAAAARRLPAPAEARAYLRRAVHAARLAGEPATTRVALLRDLADNAVAMGDYPTAVAELEEALAGPGVDDQRTLLLHRLGEARARWGRLDEAEAAYEAGVESLQHQPDPALAGRLYAGLAMVHCDRGDLDDASELAELAFVFAQSDDDPGEQAWAHHRLGIVALRRGEHARARDHAQEALVAFTGLGRPAGQAGARNTLGLLALADGDADEAVAQLEQAVELFEQAGNEHGLACALDNLADALRREGREADAFTQLERAVAILARIGLDEQTVFGTMWRAGTW